MAIVKTKGRYLAKLSLLSLAIVMLILVPLCWYFYQHYLHEPLNIEDGELLFRVPENSNLHSVANELSLSGHLKYPRLIVWHAQLNDLTRIQAGEYRFPGGATPVDVLDALNSGAVIQYSQTLVEGKTFRHMLDTLHSNPRIEALLHGLSDKQIIQALELDINHLEGWFYPDTYQFVAGSTDVAILKRAHARMQDVLNEEWVVRDLGLPFETAYEALILASIVEKETGVGHERPDIAGVFVRRLQKGMRLQTDPTVIYGLGPSFDGNLTRTHLNTAGPYNTYRNKGLPPTPIAAPGRAAIQAVLHPNDGAELYFVARGDGTHEFSATLEDHNAAVRKYQIERRAQNYRSSPN